MAIKLRSNPAPLTGALFVSNPRKRKASKKKRRVTRKRRNTARKNRRNPAHKRKNRRNGVAMRKNRRNPIAIRKNRRNPAHKARKNRRNGTKKGMARKTARRAYLKKRSNRRNRRNAIALKKNRRNRRNRRNPAHSKRVIRRVVRKNPLQPKGLMKAVKSLPAGKFLAPIVVPNIVGMLGGAGLNVAETLASRIPVVGPYVQSLGNFTPAAFGLLAGAIIQLLPKNLLKKDTKDMLTCSISFAGGAVSAYKLSQEYVQPQIESVLPATAGLAMYPAPYDYPTFSDGGMWDVVSLGN